MQINFSAVTLTYFILELFCWQYCHVGKVERDPAVLVLMWQQRRRNYYVISACRENWFYEQKRLLSVSKGGSMNRKEATNLLLFNASLITVAFTRTVNVIHCRHIKKKLSC
jgi:hypothetical protein